MDYSVADGSCRCVSLIGFTVLRFLGILAFGAAALAQNQDARRLVSELKLEQAADQAIFERVGYDHAAASLTEVMRLGQAAGATPRQWTEMHRAIGGLIELDIAKGELFNAAVHASIQDFSYKNFEGDYSAAMAASRQALDLQQRSGQTANAYLFWNSLGENLMELGRLAEGLRALHEAHRLMGDATSSLSAILWRDIVDGEIALKNLEAARRECDAFFRAAVPQAPAVFRGRAWLARADVQMEEGRYGEALDSTRAAREAVAGDKDLAAGFEYETARELLAMVGSAMHSITYAEAMELGKRIDREFPDLPFPVSPFTREALRFRRRLAGEFDALLRDDATALEQARAAGNVPSQIEILRSLAVTYGFANSGRQEIALLEQALDLERSLLPPSGIPDNAGSQYSYFHLLAALGAARARNKEAAKAGKCFDEIARGIDALPQGAAKARLASVHGDAELGKALVAELDRDFDRARELLRGALNAPANGAVKFRPSAVLLQMARLEQNADEQPGNSVRYYEDAIRTLHAEKDLRTEIAARLLLARYLAVEAANRVPDAQKGAAEQLKLAEAGASAIEFADAQWRVRFLQGIVAENANQPGQAIEFYIQAATRLDQLRAGLAQQEQRQAFMDSESIEELYHRLIAVLTAEGRKQQAWEYLERGKARSFLEMLLGRRFRGGPISVRAGGLESLEKQIVDIRAQLSPGAGATLRGDGKDTVILHAQLKDLESRFVLARQQAAMQGTRAGQELSLRPLSIAEVQAKLPPRTVLIEYALLDGKLAAFVIDRLQVVQAIWPAGTDDLRSLVKNSRELLGRRDSGEELRPVLESLSAILLQPVLPKIAAGTRTLIIVPADFLSYLPFQVLPCGDGRSLIDRFAVTYLPSASSLAFLNGAGKVTGKLFLGAIGKVSVDGMPPLPATLREVQGIEQIYSNSQIAVEKSFTHDRLRRALQENRVVHMATHGVVNEDAPLFNAVITSPSADQPSRLSLYELTDLRLTARLVVLSACNTGLGELRKGDEITGLARMFLQAGADTVVASLWSVNDRATALLMKNFYRRLHNGQTPAEALRGAALSVRKTFPQPYYWAAFVSNGVQ